MTSQERIKSLEDTKLDICENFTRICQYHKIDIEKIYYAEQNIENIFDWIIEFYKQDIQKDKTSKKALIIGMVNTISGLKIPIVTSWMHQSPIEFLLYSALENSMPPYIWEKAFMMPQVPVCNEKYYILDIALMDRRDPEKDGTEGVPIIGIECDGYDYHYNNPDKVTKTQERIRDINMTTGIKIFSYTGTEIYNNCTKLASDFWEYVERYIYPAKSKT
ncbi:MAG: hypothetical protein LKJ21_09700 [Oscillospiraceae bacterium]|nr:hypothetical protein [Oscillospiraceae bacterium]MCI1991461.1 hypothetical protein [Oscillospiraceae bacterium]MCI2036197.1 hypothetical protein [Oscillospiraceae bacterium]